ncbi:AraC family transcriptional regulator [Flexivirga meconopsidis]|uniref:AraC family transcriptional regulator n=1 Tax=Flexivirga meconopsidis TaxID=2977121 RepID=UPI002240E1B9|nr:AraC family transcriptional regulator [Flexivirga meconopsidis]
MAHSSPRVRYASLSGFAEVCREVGVDARATLRAHRLDPDKLQQPDEWAPATEVLAAIDSAAQVSGCPTIGLRMAQRRRMSTLGPISLVLRDEPTLRAAWDVLARFWPSYNESLRLRLLDDGSTVTAAVNFQLARERPHQGVELAVAVVRSLAAERLGGEAELEVLLQSPPPVDLADHVATLGTRLTFGAAHDGVRVTVADADRPLDQADPEAVRYAQRYLDSLREAADHGEVDGARRLVQQLLPAGRCSAGRVAGLLGIDRRTLHRRLEAGGYTFSSLVTEVRRRQAQDLVSPEGPALTEVAEALGFGSLSSFSRWFSGEFGSSATTFRNMNR